MRFLSILICFYFMSSNSMAQDEYKFNYLIHYEQENYLNNSNKDIFLLVNSGDNVYQARVEEWDSLNYIVVFDHHNCYRSKVYMPKKEFSKAETITFKCDFILTKSTKSIFSNKWAKKNQFISNRDTLLDGNTYKTVTFISTNRKRKKRKKLGKYKYIIDSTSIFKRPAFLNPLAYLSWKVSDDGFEGIFKERTFITFDNKIASKTNLQNIYEINKTIIIPKECKCLKK